MPNLYSGTAPDLPPPRSFVEWTHTRTDSAGVRQSTRKGRVVRHDLHSGMSRVRRFDGRCEWIPTRHLKPCEP